MRTRLLVVAAAASACVGIVEDGKRPDLVFDWRPHAATFDVSGLAAGPHEVTIDLYSDGMSPEELAGAAGNIRVLRLAPSGAGFQASELEHRGRARTNGSAFGEQVSVTFDLSLGVHVIDIPARAATVDGGAASDELPDPTTLPEADALPTYPWLLLRTVGPCNHARKFALDASSGAPATLRVETSEKLPARAEYPVELRYARTERAADFDAPGIGRIDATAVREDDHHIVVELPRPVLDAFATGRVHAQLRADFGPGFAGDFANSLSCASAPFHQAFVLEKYSLSTVAWLSPPAAVIEAARALR